MAKALGIPATDITYRKYYAEYCAMHNTELQTEERDQTQQEDEKLELTISNSENYDLNDAHAGKNGKCHNSFSCKYIHRWH